MHFITQMLAVMSIKGENIFIMTGDKKGILFTCRNGCEKNCKIMSPRNL